MTELYIVLSYPIQLTIRIQTTSEGGLTEFAFNSNRLNVNSVWKQLMRIDSHSMRIIFVVWTGLYKLSHARMFSHPKILFLVSLLFVALLNPKFNPYLLFKFLIFYHSSIAWMEPCSKSARNHTLGSGL